MTTQKASIKELTRSISTLSRYIVKWTDAGICDIEDIELLKELAETLYTNFKKEQEDK